MNLLLVEPADFIADDRVCLRDRRRDHVLQVHRATVGDELRVGLLGGPMGVGTVVHLDSAALTLQVSLTEPPPPPSQIRLLIAMPRPHSLRKILQQATAMGVKHFSFFASARVEPGYFTASAAKPAEIAEHLRLGLEQARDTVMPTVAVYPGKFHRFLAERWHASVQGHVFLAHPGPGAIPCPCDMPGPVTVVVGPEGGFIPAEAERLANLAQQLDLGPRILRIETAVVALLARLGSPSPTPATP